MEARVAIPSISVAIERGGEVLKHLLRDAVTVNSNLYGEHGCPNPFSLKSLMEGCEFYSSEYDAGGDLAALFLVSFVGLAPYFVYRTLKDSSISMAEQSASGIDDVYLAKDNAIDFHNERHVLARLIGTPGYVVGKALKAGMYTGGLLGVSSFGYHRVASAFKNCIDFIVGTKSSTIQHQNYLTIQRNIAPTIIKHINLTRITNLFGYGVTAACGVFGLTIHSMRGMRQALNVINQKIYQTDIFTISANEQETYANTERWSKEWFARGGLLGSAGIAIGAASILIVKGLQESFRLLLNGLDLARRLAGFSNYGINTLGRAWKKCFAFIFATDCDALSNIEAIDQHKTAINQTFFHKADRSWIGINRILNGFTYGTTTALSVLGFTAHSMGALQRGLNVTSQLLFKKNIFVIEENDSYNQVQRWSKEWFARAGLAGLTGIAIGSIAITTAKVLQKSFKLLFDSLDFARRLAGFSSYGFNTLGRAWKNCFAFIFATDCGSLNNIEAINRHKAAENQTLFHRADRSWIGINRILNGFSYSITTVLSVLGFTAHSMGALQRGLNVASQLFYKKNIFTIEENDFYNQVKRGSKEWFARAGLTGLAGIAMGSLAIATTKGLQKGFKLLFDTLDLARRLAGFSNYGINTLGRAWKNCFAFIFATDCGALENIQAINQHKIVENQTLFHRADRSWIGINRILNGFAYGTTTVLSVLGFTAHSMGALQRGLNVTSQLFFKKNIFVIEENDSYNQVQRWSKEWFSRASILSLGSIVAGGIAIATIKGLQKGFNLLFESLDFARRLAGFSSYGFNTLGRAWKNCFAFIFATDCGSLHNIEAINRHKAAENQTLFHRADRSWIGINRILNGFSYSITTVLSVLGFTAHSMGALQRGLNVASQLFYKKNIFTIEENDFYNQVKRGSKEWFARAGLAGLAGIAIGSLAIATTKGLQKGFKLLFDTLDLARRLAGFSNYGINTLGRAWKNCFAFIFATDCGALENIQAINQHKIVENQTLFHRADRSWIGINRILNGFAYGTTTVLSILGFTAHSMGALQRGLNVTSQLFYKKNIFTIEENDSYNQVQRGSKEWFARAGLAGLAGIAMGSITIATAKGFQEGFKLLFDTLDLARRLAGFSNYGINTLGRAWKNSFAFIFATDCGALENIQAINQHKIVDNQTLFHRADRSWIGINRILNGFAYGTTTVLSILGFTAHSMGALQRGLNVTSQLFFKKNMFVIEENDSYNQVQRGSKEWFARAGLAGLAGIAMGSLAIATTKGLQKGFKLLFESLDFARRLAGFSNYGINTLGRAWKNCFAFISGTNCDALKNIEAINQHKRAEHQTLFHRAERSWIGINRILNGFAYSATAMLGVLGLTAHSYGAQHRVLNVVSRLFLNIDMFKIDENDPYNQVQRWSKEWFARAGLLSFVRIVTGTLAILFVKALDLALKSLDFTRRLAGISMYAVATFGRAFKTCLSFISGENCGVEIADRYIAAHKNQPDQTLYDRADRTWIGINRMINGMTYGVTGIIGVLGLTTHSMGALQRALNIVSLCIFKGNIFTLDENDSYNHVQRWSKEWFARAGLLNLSGIVLGTVGMVLAKGLQESFKLFINGLDLARRLAGFSDYGIDTLGRAYKNCLSFITGTECDSAENIDAIYRHKAKENQTLFDKADRSWIGLNRILNGFAYGMTTIFGVLGLTAHNMVAMTRFLNTVNQFIFNKTLFTFSEEQDTAYKKVNCGSKEWFARGGILGLAGMAVGTISIITAKVLQESVRLAGNAFSLNRRLVGISNYSGQTIALVFKRCSNYVLGTDYPLDIHQHFIDQHKENNNTLFDRAERSWVGLNRMLNGFAYLTSGMLGVIGLTAANYHRIAISVKQMHNIAASENDQHSLKPHLDFLTRMQDQNEFTSFTTHYNLLRVLELTLKYTLWSITSLFSFVNRLAWKVTFGNIPCFGNACGNDGIFAITARNCATNDALGAEENNYHSLPNKRTLIQNPIAKMQQRFSDLLWCLTSMGDLPERPEGGTFNRAIVLSKQMNVFQSISWRLSYEVRKSASIFSLDSVAEKVILHFAATFQRYIRENRRTGTPDYSTMAGTFFNKEYRNVVNNISAQYGKKADKDIIEEVAQAIAEDIMQEMQPGLPARAWK